MFGGIARGAAGEAVALRRSAGLPVALAAFQELLQVAPEDKERLSIFEGGQLAARYPAQKRAFGHVQRLSCFFHRVVAVDFDQAPVGALRHRALSRWQ